MQKERVADAFCTYGDRILRAAFHLTGSRSEAEDCTQEAFMRLLSQPDTMEQGHIYPWLMRTVINLSKDYLRSIWFRKRVSMREIHNMTVSAPMTAEEETALYAVLQLPEKYRIPLYLHLVEGYSFAEISKILRVNVNTISSRVRRARQKLQSQLRDDVDIL